ncbi:MAG TPA: dihydroorotase [Fimbriimonadaceae bacterium]|nr:dihydroorotase [Fimbriimonadaceae bacterium]
MHFDLLVRRGQVVSGSGIEEGDVGIKSGRIEEVGSLKDATADETIDAGGLHILPGLIDTQVHFREPGMEHKEDIESGTRAAIFGGVTTIFEMPNTNPTTTTREALEDKLRRAGGRAWCDYSFFVGASTDNIDVLPELEMLPGTPGIKIFAGSSTGSLLVERDEDLRRVLAGGKRRCPIHSEDEARNRERKALLSPNPHAREHPFLRDAESARLSTDRILRLSAETGRPVHILHVSTADEIPLLEKAKVDGLGTTCEITPQHLWFAAPEAYERLGSLAQMNPPIRSEEHRQALRDAVRAGLFDVVGSDHAPHTLDEKSKPYPQSPSGLPGVQTLLQVMLTLVKRDRLISLEELVTLACEGPARIYGIEGKGAIRKGMDADLVLIDLAKDIVFERSMVQSKCGWSPFEGETLNAPPTHVLLRGRAVIRDGVLTGRPCGAAVGFEWK